MKQIELVLQNDGVKRNVIFPCTEAEYQAACKALALKDNYAFVRDVVEPKTLALKKDTFVNLDEINYLAKRMDSFDQKELFSFFAAIETGDYVSTKDLINLTFNQTCYTLIRDVSNLKNIGYNRVLSSRGCIGVDELEKMDLEKIGRELLSTGKGIPTKYGLLFRNENVVFEEVYKGRGFPPYYYTGGEVLGVEIEKDGEKDYIYFPCEKTETDRALKRIGAERMEECEKTVDFVAGGVEWEKCFDKLLQENDTESVNAIAKAICRLGMSADGIEESLYKLSAVAEYAGVGLEETGKVILLAQQLDEFGYYREIGDDETLGRTLKEQEFCDIPESMDKYMDYGGYARDFLEGNGGRYTKAGDAVYLKGEATLSEILDESDIKMGGI
mgnify:FL=1